MTAFVASYHLLKIERKNHLNFCYQMTFNNNNTVCDCVKTMDETVEVIWEVNTSNPNLMKIYQFLCISVFGNSECSRL